ncbi:hypothetical protein BJV82DRAFT_655731 [Fennellomyces sp. T-0311]|nr:hypothetical protein BJV82DRAFT_655731 [Fennellomyces sp. T-0311]
MPNLSPSFKRPWNEEEESLDESEFEDEGAATKIARIKNVPQRLQQLSQSSAVTAPLPPHYNIELQLIFGGTFEPDRPVSPTLDAHYFRMISIQRTQLHSAINNWLTGYTFPGCDFPAEICPQELQARWKVPLLAVHHRLYRQCACLWSRDQEAESLPPPHIQGVRRAHYTDGNYTNAKIVYWLGKKISDMEKQEGEKVTDDAAGGPGNAVNEDSGGTKGKRTVQKDEFKWDSFWDRAYRDMLSSTGELGKYISWLPVQKWVYEHIEHANLKASNAERSVAELFAGVIRQEELQAHQPYSMAPEAPEADIVRTQAKPVKRRRMN